MKIFFLVVGKTEQEYLKKGISIYQDRLSHYSPFEMVVIPDIKGVSGMTKDQIKAKEGELILKTIKDSDELILLDERGREYSSEEFSAFIEKKLVHGVKSIVFVVGGAYGFSPEVYQRASGKISLSRMTFSHQMVRLVFTEQLYRAFTIIKGEPYHHK